MFGYYERINLTRNSNPIDITTLVGLIKNHPEKDKVQLLHTFVKGSLEYRNLKKQLPCIMAPSVCGDTNEETDILFMSGYLFFDIDLPEDLAGTINSLLTTHKDKISLLSKSVGGKGVSFYIKCSGLTKENYRVVYQNLSLELAGYKLDMLCINPTRMHVIPFDPNVYFNPEACISANAYLKGEIKSALSNKGYIKHTPGIPLNDKTQSQPFKLIPFDELLKKIKWESYSYEGPDDFEIKEVEYCRLVYPGKTIIDGEKRKTFTRLLTTLIYCNPSFSRDEILSFLNFVNSTKTDREMVFAEVVKLTDSVIKGIRNNTIKAPTRSKYLHINKNFAGDKKAMANRINAAIRTSRSRQRINKIIEILRLGGEEQSVKNIAKYTGLSMPTVYRHIGKEPIIDAPDEVFDSILNELMGESEPAESCSIIQ